eukprot:m.19601 g.19601  ORF g.19601 m.19601 type:complete len:580 (+) comp3754_c0_seq1:3-1742(+)
MVLLSLNRFSLSVGSTQLLDSVDAQLVEGQRVALVGPNGCGKSTLLRALAGRKASTNTEGTGNSESSEDYYLVGTNGISGTLHDGDAAGKLLFVQQDNLSWSSLVLRSQEQVGGFSEDDLREMTVPEALDTAAALFEDAVDEVDAWRRVSVAADELLEWRTARYDETPINQLSPGSAVRAYLAVALARQSIRLLLLDEPTNHLDLPSVLWLQHALIASGKTVLLVSHDVAFLDAVATQIWLIDPIEHSLTMSSARYSDFMSARALAQQQQQAAFEAQKVKHKRLAAVADKLRSASSAGAQFAAKDHDTLQRDFKRDRAGRSGHKAKAMKTRIEKEPLVQAVARHVPLTIELEPVEPGGESSIVLTAVRLGYPGHVLDLADISLRIDYGERVAFVGFNGAGKTTLLRTMLGELEPQAGEVRLGRNLRLGNLTQEHESLPRDKTPREFIMDLTDVASLNACSCLIHFGLNRRQVDCPIGELNPGARARVLLASFSIRRVNTLVLDEPTNHLDEEAVLEVTATINDYSGTVIIVSHSRPFLTAVRLTRVLRLASDGLTELDSLESFVTISEDAARAVVEQCS